MKLVKAMIGSTDLDANALGTEEAGGPVLLVLIGLLGMRLVMLDPYHLLILGRKYYTPDSYDKTYNEMQEHHNLIFMRPIAPVAPVLGA